MKGIVIAAALCCTATPALAQGIASQPSGDGQPSSMQGIYAAVGGGGALLIVGNSNAFGYDAEARLGYSFNPGLQIYLSGSLDGASIAGIPFRSEMYMAFVQYHLYASGPVRVFGRAGIGVARSGSFDPNNTGVGLAEAGGLGLEIRLAPALFIAPELFYKNAALSVSGAGTYGENVIGLQIALIYY